MGQVWCKAKKMGAAAVMALLLAGCGAAGQMEDGTEEGILQADYFAYVDEENKLFFWRQGEEEALLLTDKAFALEEKGAEEKSDIPYWEEWEYWQEWDDDRGGWIWNYEKAMQGIVKEAAEGMIYYPQEMEWKSFCMERSAGEREEARKYAKEEPVESYAGVKMFLYDLYRYENGMDEEESEKVAENVCYYSIDKKGNVWYCKAEEDGTKEAGGVTYPFARCMLYRYDGEENLKIAEINGRRKGVFRTNADGDYVIFYTLDDSLCGCGLEGKAGMHAGMGTDAQANMQTDARAETQAMPMEILVEDADTDMFSEDSIYTNEDMSKIIYAGSSIVLVEEGKERKILGDGESLLTGMLGKEGDRMFIAAFEKEVSYADWVDWEKETMDQDTRRLKELMEKKSYRPYPYLSLCHASVVDIAAQENFSQENFSQEKFSLENCEIQSMDGYLLSWAAVDGMSVPREVYYIKIIPAEPFEKFTLSELLGEDTPEDVLTYYEELKESGYYENVYEDEYEEYVFSEALNSCIDMEALEKRAELYAVTAEGMRRMEEVENKGWIINDDYNENGDKLYFSVYWNIEPGENGRNSKYYWYSFLEDRYVLDKEGNCVKVAEAADETVVRGDEVFYSRIAGIEGMISLYRSAASGCIAEAVSISLESIRKSSYSDAIIFLADGLAEKGSENGIHVEAEKELLKAYYGLADGKGRYERRSIYGEEMTERTLVLDDGSGAKKLGEDILQYGFYGMDNVWMMQYEDTEEIDDKEDDWEDWDREDSRKGGSRLYIYENGEKKQIAERAVWMAEPECPKAAGYMKKKVSWVYE